MKNFASVFVAAVTLLVGASTFAQDTRICTVDLQSALASVNDGQAALQNLTSELERRQQQINVQQTELEEWMAELESQIAVLSPTERQERLAEYERRVAALQEAFQTNQIELSEAEAAATRQIAERMMVIVEEYAASNACTYVVQSSAVLIAPDGADFTADLIQAYNARH